jgi:hypothetical protein
MSEHVLRSQEADELFEDIDTEEELSEYLDGIAPYIGWIIIYFNSLEDGVSGYIREAILRDPIQDERLDVFLAEMLFSGKCRSLMHLYGQMIGDADVKYTHDDLNELEKLLLECARRRNDYAHADWISLKQQSYVRVKSQSKKLGLFHRYKKFEIMQMEADVAFIANARHVLDEFNENINDQLFGREASS